MVFPVDGSEEKTWELTAAQLAQWQEIYPDLDVARECRNAWAWIDANPTKRKKATGMKRFLVNWLNRAKPMRKVPVFTEKPDKNGHVPPCTNWMDCNRRALAEWRAEKAQAEAQQEFQGLLTEAKSDRWR